MKTKGKMQQKGDRTTSGFTQAGVYVVRLRSLTTRRNKTTHSKI